MPTIINPILPNVLQNGTTADATQVMADFAAIISQVNANAAENGANSSITSLSGLTTPLSVGQGGTGVNTLAQYAVVLGNAASALATAAPGVAKTVLASNGVAANPSFQGLSAVLVASDVSTALGFTPVQQGTGTGQFPGNLVKLGWSTASGNGLRATVDSTDLGYFVMSLTNATAGWTVSQTFNSQSGLFDNGSRVWSGNNYQPLTVNGIGYDCWSTNIGATEGQLVTLGGKPGTWMCQSSASASGLQPFRRVS